MGFLANLWKWMGDPPPSPRRWIHQPRPPSPPESSPAPQPWQALPTSNEPEQTMPDSQPRLSSADAQLIKQAVAGAIAAGVGAGALIFDATASKSPAESMAADLIEAFALIDTAATSSPSQP